MYSRIAARLIGLLRPLLPAILAVVFLVLCIGAETARAAQSLAFDTLQLQPAPGVPCAPCEVRIKGVSGAADWAALRVEVTPAYPALNAEIDATKGVLRFTPTSGVWWSRNFTLRLLSNRYPSASATLTLQILDDYDSFTARAVDYTVADSPVVLVNRSLVVYPQGRRKNEIAICLPAAPSDFALRADGSEAYVLFGGSGSVQCVDLAALRLGSSVQLANFGKSGASPYNTTCGRIAFGRDGQLLALDEQGALRRHNLSTGAVLQTLPKPPENFRWVDVATSPDRNTLWIHAATDSHADLQTTLFRAPIGAKGAVGALVAVARSTGPAKRDYGATPLPCRILQSLDGHVLAVDQRVFSVLPGGEVAPLRDLPAEAVSLTASGELLGLTRGGVCDLAADHVFTAQTEGNYYYPLPPIYFFGGTYLSRAPYKASLAQQYESEVVAPLFGSVSGKMLLPPEQVAWPAFPGADAARIEFREIARRDGTLEPALTVLDKETTAGEVALSAPLRVGSTYAWRLRPAGFSSLADDELAALAADFGGEFTVVDALPSSPNLTLETLEGLPAYDVPLQISTAATQTAWTLQSSQPWLQPLSVNGTGPARVSVRIDARALSAGVNAARSATLALSTAAGAVTIPVSLEVRPPTYSQLVSHPTDPRCFALVKAPWPSPPWLVEIDASARRFVRGVPLPAGTDKFLYHPDDYAIYLRTINELESNARLHAISINDLALRTVGEIPRTGSLAAAGPRRILLPIFSYTSSEPSRLIDTSSGASGPGPSLHNARCLVSEDGRTLYRFFVTYVSEQGRQAMVEKLALTEPGFPILGSRLAPANQYGDVDYAFLGPDRLLVGGREFDLDLNPLPATASVYPEVPATPASGSLRLAQSLAYDTRSPQSPRAVAATAVAKTLNPATGCFVSASADSRSLVFKSWAELAPAAIPTISLATLTHESIGLSTADLPAGATCFLSCRRAGLDEWPLRQSYGASAVSLQADTDYELRLRYTLDGVSSAWSGVLPVRTLIAPPRWDYANTAPGANVGRAGSDFSYVLPVLGTGITVSVDGLPDGLSFDPDTRTISGVPSVSGRHTLKITAQNSSGAQEWSMPLYIEAESVRAQSARYAGLIDLTESAGPLIGEWRIVRSGNVVTGAYRSMLFSRSFKLSFDRGDFVDPLKVYGYGSCRYQDVPIYLSATWDKANDQILLSGHTSDLIENFSFNTADDEGEAGHWTAAAKPYPHTTRFTGLLFAESGVPEGCGFLSVTIKPDGTVSTVGETSLGQKFTLVTYLSDAQRFPFFHRTSDTLMVGGLQIGPDEHEAPRLAGGVFWGKDAKRKARAYPEGFEQSLLVFGAPLPATGKNLPPLSPLANEQNRAWLILSEGGLDRLSKPIAQVLAPGPAGFLAPKPGTPANPNRVAVKLDPKTGLVTGTAAILDTLRPTKVVRSVKFRGMLVKDPLGDAADLVGGYFLLPDAAGDLRSGLLQIIEPEAEAVSE